MQRDKISKQKCSSNDPVSKPKKSKGQKKKNAKNVLDCNPSKSSDSGIPFDDIEMEIAMGHNELPDTSKKACNKNEKLATSSKHLDGDIASEKENSKTNSSSPNGEIETNEGDDVMDEDIGDEYDVPTTESEGGERAEASKKSQSESDLSLETTEDNASQDEQEAEDGKASVDNEEEGSTVESDDENENNESSGGESEHVSAEDFVDQEAEEGSETDDDEESIFESEITLSSDEEKKEALFAGGSRMASGTAAKNSDQRYDDDESDDLGGFIVDDDFIEPMSDDEAADHPDVCLEDDAGTKKHRRIVTLPDSSDSEHSESELGPAPQRGKKPQSKKESQSSVKATGARDELKQATGGKHKQNPNLELSSAKSKRKKAKDQMHVGSEQEASTSKVPGGNRIPEGTSRQVSNRSLSSKVPLVSRPLRSPKLASPVRPRLSRLDEFRISKGLSPAVKRREARDGSENWVVSDVQVSIRTPAPNLSPPNKKYAKLVTLSKKKDTDNACVRALKRSRCESESPIPRKKSRR